MDKKLKKRLKSIIASLVVLMVVAIYNYFGLDEYINGKQSETQVSNNNIQNGEKIFCKVVRVVDGDTFVIKYNGKDEKVRLIGVDTPESVHPDEKKNTGFGEQVSDFSKKMLSGKNIEIEFDVQQRDKYGRLLAYVYLDGQMYNKLLLEKGYAKLATYPPNVKYVENFTVIQKQARQNNVGLWAD